MYARTDTKAPAAYVLRINGCQMVSLLCLWESLRVLELDMTCEVFTCGEKEADSIINLLVAMPLCKLEIIDAIIQPKVIVPEDAWLGSLKAFQPDPQQWVPRPLQKEVARGRCSAAAASSDANEL